MNKRDRRALRRAWEGKSLPGTLPERRQRRLEPLMTTHTSKIPVSQVPRIGEEIAEGQDVGFGTVLIGSWDQTEILKINKSGTYSAIVMNGMVHIFHSQFTRTLPDGTREYVLPPELME